MSHWVLLRAYAVEQGEIHALGAGRVRVDASTFG